MSSCLVLNFVIEPSHSKTEFCRYFGICLTWWWYLGRINWQQYNSFFFFYWPFYWITDFPTNNVKSAESIYVIANKKCRLRILTAFMIVGQFEFESLSLTSWKNRLLLSLNFHKNISCRKWWRNSQLWWKKARKVEMGSSPWAPSTGIFSLSTDILPSNWSRPLFGRFSGDMII